MTAPTLTPCDLTEADRLREAADRHRHTGGCYGAFRESCVSYRWESWLDENAPDLIALALKGASQ